MQIQLKKFFQIAVLRQCQSGKCIFQIKIQLDLIRGSVAVCLQSHKFLRATNPCEPLEIHANYKVSREQDPGVLAELSVF